MADWWVDLYDDLMAEAFLAVEDADRVARTVAFLEEVLALSPGDRLFDQCCGTGRLAIPLAERGYDVVGVDQCADYVACAEGRFEAVAADARTFVAIPPAQAAFNWWTSFGYADDDASNRAMIRRAAESLTPGGRFALDTMNVPQVLRAFEPESERVVETKAGPLTVIRRSRLDLERGQLHKQWRYERAGQVTEHASRVRLYLPHELIAFFEAEAFVDVRCFGDEDGSPLGVDSPRCIVVGTRA